MRTTINLPDSLLLQAKKSAAERGATLTEFIADALRMALQLRKRGKRKIPPLPTFAATPGREGVLPGVDLTDTSSLIDLMEADDATHRR